MEKLRIRVRPIVDVESLLVVVDIEFGIGISSFSSLKSDPDKVLVENLRED